MENNQSLILNNSILYRCSSKFYDKQLSKYNIGSGQLLFLLSVYENEGITMNDMSKKGMYDKGTVSKTITKLIDEGYITLQVNQDDKRVKNLYTTQKTKDVIGDLYLIRSQWFGKICENLSEEEIQSLQQLLQKCTNNAMEHAEELDPHIKLYGLQKTTLLDFPGKLACSLFTGGCNLRCPFCHNKDLVFLPEEMMELDETELFDYLQKRHGILEGVCISGGEPLLQDLKPLLRQIKELGYPIKLDTNGFFYDYLKELVDEKLIDYVAVDIKNSPEKYGMTTGLSDLKLEQLEKTIQFLLNDSIPYQFRTTVVQQFHTAEDMHKIGKWIRGAKKMVLQCFKDSDHVIQSGLSAPSEETLYQYQSILLEYVEDVEIKGL